MLSQPTASPKTVIAEIVALNQKCADFWHSAHGWAPDEAAELLARARLDWQVSLSETLEMWVSDDCHPLDSGRLILAWVNLGALVEGTLKLLFCVYYCEYAENTEALKYAGAMDRKRGVPEEPDGINFDKLRKFLLKIKLFADEANAVDLFVTMVQHRRNAIHAFKDRDLGTIDDFKVAVADYLWVLKRLEARLPYPEHAKS